MKIIQLKEAERIKEGLRSLTDEFIEEYPYVNVKIKLIENFKIKLIEFYQFF